MISGIYQLKVQVLWAPDFPIRITGRKLEAPFVEPDAHVELNNSAISHVLSESADAWCSTPHVLGFCKEPR
jgi:hypothetical protein